jgi:hypothetical protein
MDEQKQQDASEGIVGQSASTGGLGAWLPIETAPESRHGERPKYVLFYNGHHVGTGYRYPAEDDDDSWVYADECGEFIFPIPTHWMPLPEAPNLNSTTPPVRE